MKQSCCCSWHRGPGPVTGKMMVIRKWGLQRSQCSFGSLRLEKPLLGQSDDTVPISGCKEFDLYFGEQFTLKKCPVLLF